MSDGVPHDMRRMHVRKLVDHLPSTAACSHQPSPTEYAEVLADEGLRHADGVDQFVHAIRMVCQQVDYGEPYRGGKGAK
jgi:hypothetical protein